MPLPTTHKVMLNIGNPEEAFALSFLSNDSAIVAHLFDERNPAVQAMIASVIKTAKARGRKIGLYGQAPSDYPEFAQFLVEQGIESMSLNPDAVLKTLLAMAEMDKTRPGCNHAGCLFKLHEAGAQEDARAASR